MEAVLEPNAEISSIRSTAVAAHTFLVFVIASACLMFMLGDAPLARTEGHRAITAHQMVLSGDYLIPTLYGHVYLTKPPLQYWAIALAEKLFGASEFSARLPAALSTALLAALVCAMTARWFDYLAGFFAGIACLGLVALWSQARAADVDALNTFGAVAASLAIVDIGLSQRPSPSIVALAAIGFGVSLLTKGPAGLPIVVGAIVGPAIASRNWKLFRNRAIGLALLLGIVMFLLWIAAVLFTHGTRPVDVDARGLEETKLKFIITDFNQLLLALASPWMTIAYGLPFTGAGLIALVPSLNRNFEPKHRAIMKTLVATVLAAFVMQMVAGTGNPRYEFLNLPLLCPLVGAIAFGWIRGYFKGTVQRLSLLWFPGVATAYAGVATVLLLMCWKSMIPHPALIGGMIVAGLIAALSWVALHLGRIRVSATAAVLAICAGAIAFGFQKNYERTRASAASVSDDLTQLISSEAPVVTFNVVWSQPELFYYAHIDPHVGTVAPEMPPTKDSWLVIDDAEWNVWQQDASATIHPVVVGVLRPFKHIIYVCWYSPTGTPPPRT